MTPILADRTLETTQTAQAELDRYLEEQSDTELFIDDLANLAIDIDTFLQKREKTFRTVDPELQAEVDQELVNLKSRVKGLALHLGIVAEVLNKYNSPAIIPF